jgi:putative membrane protein
MIYVTDALIAIIALLHVYFLVVEMFLWRKPYGLRVFKMDQATADASAVLAANQGLYNSFLAAGLFWGLLAGHNEHAFSIKVFFLNCIVVAGVYGGLTANRKILFIQALPAVIALLFVVLFQVGGI